MLGGPLGAIAGGALGGASTRSDKNKLKGALKGAALAGLYTAGAPALFHGLGGTQGGIMAKIAGAGGIGNPSLLNQLGVSSAPNMGGGLGFYGNMGQKGIFEGLGGVKGFAAKIPGGKYLLPAAQHGFGKMLSGRGQRFQEAGPSREHDPYGYSSSVVNPTEPVPAIPLAAPSKQQQEHQKVSDIVNNPQLSALDKLLQILQVLESEKPGEGAAQQAQNLQREEVPHQGFDAEGFKRGGYVHGSTGGQDDKVPTDLHEGDYVMDATTVSLLGDGNSHNGAQKVKEIEGKFMNTGIVRNPARNYNVRSVKAKVSPGEYIIKKEVVDAAGRGNNKQGAKVFDKFRNNLRSHKGVKKFLPPKSKPVERYFGRGSVR